MVHHFLVIKVFCDGKEMVDVAHQIDEVNLLVHDAIATIGRAPGRYHPRVRGLAVSANGGTLTPRGHGRAVRQAGASGNSLTSV